MKLIRAYFGLSSNCLASNQVDSSFLEPSLSWTRAIQFIWHTSTSNSATVCLQSFYFPKVPKVLSSIFSYFFLLLFLPWYYFYSSPFYLKEPSFFFFTYSFVSLFHPYFGVLGFLLFFVFVLCLLCISFFFLIWMQYEISIMFYELKIFIRLFKYVLFRLTFKNLLLLSLVMLIYNLVWLLNDEITPWFWLILALFNGIFGYLSVRFEKKK